IQYRKSGLHTDSQDPLGVYTGLLAAGSFTGWYIHLPRLNLQVRLHPGDFAFIKGKVHQHCIKPWHGGQQVGIPHFTHTSLWRDCGLEDLVDMFLFHSASIQCH
ncbi:hypothetical protein FPV67DRAFT_1429753, partial [Lyophyllum atratum]